MDKDNLPARGKHQIRLTWKILAVKAKPIPQAMHKASDRPFG